MKIVKKYNILVIMGLLFMTSCYEFVELNNKNVPDPKLIINCIVEPDSIIYANISQSYYLYKEDNKSNRSVVDSAEVKVYINDVYQGKMTLNKDSSVVIPYPTHYSSFKASAGDRVRIEATSPDGRNASGESIVIHRVKIISVDTLTVYDSYNARSLSFFVKSKDLEVGKPNYYAIAIMQKVDYYDKDGNLTYSHSSQIPFEYEQDPILSSGFNGKVMSILDGGTDAGFFRTFSDELFDGKEYTLNIQTYNSYGTGYNYGDPTDDGSYLNVSFGVILTSLSLPLYSYYKSISLIDENGLESYGLSEPVRVFSNITNGLGIVGSSGSDTYTITQQIGNR